MKRNLPRILCVLAGCALLMAAQASIQYFTHVRDVQVKDAARLSYLIIDRDVWSHSREDLGDLRIYSGTQEVPYAMHVMGAGRDSAPRDLKILNLGTGSAGTSFVLDTEGAGEYNEITLEIDRRDFVTRATVEGADTNPSPGWTTLASGALFDYSKEKLGKNGTILLPPSTFRYLRVTIPQGVKPEEIKGASGCSTVSDQESAWESYPLQPAVSTENRKTSITFETSSNLPVDRIHFRVPAEKTNFRRAAQVETRQRDARHPEEEGAWRETAAGEISRVLVRQRAGNEIHENLVLNVYGTRGVSWRIAIENGDDPPLPLQVEAETKQRRLYFDPRGATSLKLYYGDERLTAPVYDYAKFFRIREAKDAVAATLAPSRENSAFTGRPDDRPWTERHPWVLWAAMAVAILGVGALAVRGLKSA